ncbi:MAG TPA: OsmC family protein [Thermomicrobiales bacterium]|nr:OsmC family protein [Thermomicrobiales bacterium]
MVTKNGSTATEAPANRDFKSRQRALKASYAENPELAKQTTVVKSVTPDDAETGKVRIAIDNASAVEVDIGAHCSVGGTEDTGCSGDYFLASLAGCYEVTLRLVASSLKLTINRLDLRVEGDWDARGTLGTDKEAPVGYTEIRVIADVDAEGPEKSLARLGELTERYCVVSQTLKNPPSVEVTWR